MKEFIENFKSDVKKVLKGILIFFGGFTALVVGIALLTTDNKDKGVVKDTHVDMKVSKEQALINQQKAKEKAEEDKKIQEERIAQHKLEVEEKNKKEAEEMHNSILKNADENILRAIDFIKETTKLLEKKYANKDTLISCEAHIFIIDEIIRENAPQKEDAKSVRKSLDILTRKVIASNMEEIFMKNGTNFEVKTIGKEAKILQVKNVLMNKQIAYDLVNKNSFGDLAKKYEFDKIVFTDGFDNSYTYDFK